MSNDSSDSMQALLAQERALYTTSDYLRMETCKTGARIDAVSSSVDVSSRFGTKRRKLNTVVSPSKEEPRSRAAVVTPQKKNGTAGNSALGDLESAELTRKKHWREKMCEWAYSVVDHFDVNREVVCIAMNYVDRYSECNADALEKDTFQLLSMTCLYLSMKLYEHKTVIIEGSSSAMDTMLKLSRGRCSLEEMELMELDVLQRLQWHVHPPTPQLFVAQFLSGLSMESAEVKSLAIFMAELAVMDYFFVAYKSSEIACAALLTAVERLFTHSNQPLDSDLLNQLRAVQTGSVMECQERMALIYSDSMTDPSHVAEDGGTQEAEEYRTASPVSVTASFLE